MSEQLTKQREEVEDAVQQAIMWRRKRQLKRRQEYIGIAIIAGFSLTAACMVGTIIWRAYG